MLTGDVKKELKRIVGDEYASFSKEDMLCYAYDATNIRKMPDAVVFSQKCGRGIVYQDGQCREVSSITARSGFRLYRRECAGGARCGAVNRKDEGHHRH